MKKLTYKQAYDKIIEAYFKDEIRPFDAQFCFCGTLNNNESTWIFSKLSDYRQYSPDEFFMMETGLYSGFTRCGLKIFANQRMGATNAVENWESVKLHKEYEDALFNGMCAALEVLKQIHKDRGENVEDFQFTKRQLV